MHDVFWCVLCVWAKLPEIKLDDDDDVSRKSNENRQFSNPRVFNAPAEGVPLGILYRRMGL